MKTAIGSFHISSRQMRNSSDSRRGTAAEEDRKIDQQRRAKLVHLAG